MIEDRSLTRDDLPFPLDRPLTGQDLLQLLNGLMQPLWSHASNAVRGDIGKVTAVNTGPPKTITVAYGPGDDTDSARYFASYAPAVNDTVLVIRNRVKAICLGKLA